jgi:hypothetical protein
MIIISKRININADELINLYCNEVMTSEEISKIYNCHYDTILNKLRKLGVKIRKGNDKAYKKDKIKTIDKCIICNKKSDTNHKSKGEFYCSKHYSQIQRYGKILERTKFDKNEIILKSEYAEICLYDKKHNINGIAIIDITDLDLIKQHKWAKDKQGYVVTRMRDPDGKNHRLSMHRFLLNPKDYELVDHINFNKSDNRRSNLRIVTKSQNEMHKLKRNNNTSGVKGVSFYKSKNKWAAELTVNQKKVYRKCFDNFEDAVEARYEVELTYFGEYSPINQQIR